MDIVSTHRTPRGQGDLALEEGDRVFIPGRAHYKEGALVYIDGEVVHPGPYSIKEGVDGVRSTLQRAGGLTEFADVSLARIERRSDAAARDTAFLRLADHHQDLLSEDERGYVKLRTRERIAISADLSRVLSGPGDVTLFDGDRIVVPRRNPSVSVQGEVRSPGLVPYEAGRHADSYVRIAGGFTDRARKSHMRVTVARTGQQMRAGEAGVIHAGDTVWVPARPERSKWTTLRDVLTTAAQIATVYLVINQATK